MANNDPVELLKEMNTATKNFHAKNEQDKKKNEELKMTIVDLKKKISEYDEYLKNTEEDYNHLRIRQYKLDERNIGAFGGPPKIYPDPNEAGAAGAASTRVYRAPPPLPPSATSEPPPSATSEPPASAASAPPPPPPSAASAPPPPLAMDKEKEMREKMKAVLSMVQK